MSELLEYSNAVKKYCDYSHTLLERSSQFQEFTNKFTLLPDEWKYWIRQSLRVNNKTCSPWSQESVLSFQFPGVPKFVKEERRCFCQSFRKHFPKIKQDRPGKQLFCPTSRSSWDLLAHFRLGFGKLGNTVAALSFWLHKIGVVVRSRRALASASVCWPRLRPEAELCFYIELVLKNVVL